MGSLKGVWGTIQIPFNEDDSVDYMLLDEQISFWSQASVHGIYSNGTAAEFYNQTEDEFDRINALMAEKCTAGRMPFQIGASHMSPVISFQRIRRTKQLKPIAFQVIFPDWLPLTAAEQRAFLFRMVEEADPVPLVLYLPGHAKNKLSLDQVIDLSKDVPGLIGIKSGFVKTDNHDAMRVLNQRLAVFIPGHHMATGLNENIGSGSYSNVACINPDATRIWYDQINTDPEKGLQTEATIQRFFEQYVMPLVAQGYSDPALDKLLAVSGGKIPVTSRLRWPYKGFDDTQVAMVRQAGQRLLPDFFL